MRRTLAVIVTCIALFSPALADGLSSTVSLGTSPIGQVFSVRGALNYDLTLVPNLTLTTSARINYNSANGFGLSFLVAPKYTYSLISDGTLDVSVFAGAVLIVGVVPTPVTLLDINRVGVDVSYVASPQVTVLGGGEVDLSLNFDGTPIVASPYLGFYAEGDYQVTDALSLALGANVGTDFAAFYYNPYLNAYYTLSPMVTLIGELGYDNGAGGLANANGTYVFLRAKVKF